MPCPGKTFVNGITWYSPIITKPEELSFCEECYNQFIRNTPLNIHMRNDGTFIGVCDFSAKIRELWLAAVRENNIDRFNEYVQSKIEDVRTMRTKYAQLYSNYSLEIQRRGVLVSSQFKSSMEDTALKAPCPVRPVLANS
ncbi:19759_t:CDS:2 [Cetraspora pellucida]|uniref:19759_t:CDS:1 n=1 Tax=Cetraspora pellucida TaxID=1433469 RepID=A0A9N9HV24_9GLOM|nr:19759_t:CDS:2 [Cetraspora pellucida]